MTPFVVAAFQDRAAAERALERLRSSGLAIRDVRLHTTTSDVTNADALATDEVASGGFFSNAVELLDELLGTPRAKDEAADYVELVRREATLVSVHVESTEAAEQACALLQSEGAVRASTLPQRGLES
ncbi:MAG: hypothetical protein JO090_13605 [Rhizobacter sp.]|nr:hypothetical protein [Rhizobacter sp.]